MKYTLLKESGRQLNPLAPRGRVLVQRKNKAARKRRGVAGGDKTMDEHIAALKVEAAAKKKGQRTQYHHEDFVFDAQSERYWNLEDFTNVSREVVNTMIPKDEWYTRDVPRANGAGFRTVPIKPSEFIARIENDKVVEGVAWWPGLPRIIKDILVVNGEEKHVKGRRTLNTYLRPQHHATGDPAKADVWIEHVRKLYPEEADVLLDYFAHTVQHPEVKINFGLVLIGESGIGKDMMLTPVKRAVGEHNTQDVTPKEITSQFTGWKKCVLLTINEARSADSDFKATDFYELLKELCAAPPDWLQTNPKYGKQETVRNLLRVVITTNHALALYVPEDDRRLYFAKSKLPEKWADSEYFYKLASYYEAGGNDHVYAYLRQRDISKFDPKRHPAPNAAHMAATASWNQAVNDPLMDVLDELKWPDVFFGAEILSCDVASFDNRDEVMRLLKSSRQLAMRMSKLGYEQHSSPDKNNGWQYCSPSKKPYRVRVAFVKHGYTGDWEAERDRRGREIAANGNNKATPPERDFEAARPKVVPIKGVES
ncbi:MAG: hypothetical protein KKA22_03995 [Gammaproteobacteria bacterium]|nr:hypothetical protein [Gammaproteobacteria bacterium]MBU1407291.1 hypothetical protein [Gammaproteobacteria bacterium]MBU1531335.1 hypothetical protein [Gammaproteobacteria bacterium]